MGEDLADAEVVDEGAPSAARPLGDLLDTDEVHVRFHPSIIGAVMEPGSGLDKRIGNMRRHVAQEFGFVMPEVRLTDDPLLPGKSYVILIQGIEVAQAALEPGHVLVLLNPDEPTTLAGRDTTEPVYGAPARWIEEREADEGAAMGLAVITPGEVVATHLLETLKANFGRLLTRRALRKLLDEFARPSDPARAEANKRLLDEFVPEKVPLDLLQALLRALLDERVPVRNLPLILEAAAEARASGLGLDAVVEHVRRRIAFLIVARLCDAEGRLPLVQLGPEWENLFAAHERREGEVADVILPPDEFNRLASAVRGALAESSRRGLAPVVATSGRRRRFLRSVLEAKGVDAPVLSFEEIGTRTRLSLVGTA